MCATQTTFLGDRQNARPTKSKRRGTKRWTGHYRRHGHGRREHPRRRHHWPSSRRHWCTDTGHMRWNRFLATRLRAFIFHSDRPRAHHRLTTRPRHISSANRHNRARPRNRHLAICQLDLHRPAVFRGHDQVRTIRPRSWRHAHHLAFQGNLIRTPARPATFRRLRPLRFRHFFAPLIITHGHRRFHRQTRPRLVRCHRRDGGFRFRLIRFGFRRLLRLLRGFRLF